MPDRIRQRYDLYYVLNIHTDIHTYIPYHTIPHRTTPHHTIPYHTIHTIHTLHTLHTLHYLRRGGTKASLQANAQAVFFSALARPQSVQLGSHLHTDPFTHRRLYTQTLFSHRAFDTQTSLHRNAFTHRPFYTQTLLQTDTFTHRHFYKQTLLHTDPFTHAHAFSHCCCCRCCCCCMFFYRHF